MRDAERRPPLERLPGLDAAASAHARRHLQGAKGTVELGDDVHSTLGPHAAAAVDVVEAISDVAQLRQARLQETRLVGIGCALSADQRTWVGVIVYADRDAWPHSREERALLRRGVEAYVEGFHKRYRQDPAWMRRYNNKDTQALAVAEVRAEAAAAARISADELERRLRLAPTVLDAMTMRVLEDQLHAERVYAAKLLRQPPPERPRSRRFAEDL